MFQTIGNLIGPRTSPRGGPLYPEARMAAGLAQPAGPRVQAFSKVFRWRLPDGQTSEPATVEIVGTFTHWQKVPLNRDSVLDAWHTTIHHIQNNKTHHYMLLVDGKPTQDKNCDGMAIAHGPVEETFQLATDRGPRVHMLFAQTR